MCIKKVLLLPNRVNIAWHLPISRLISNEALLLVWLDCGSLEFETWQRYSARSDILTPDISSCPEGNTFILWSRRRGWSSFSQTVTISGVDDVAVTVPRDNDEVGDDTRHSNTAIWSKNTFVSFGSDSNIGDAREKRYLRSNVVKNI